MAGMKNVLFILFFIPAVIIMVPVGLIVGPKRMRRWGYRLAARGNG